MKAKHLFGAVTLVLMLSGANAALQAEDAMESQSGFILLPASALGKVTASSCAGCQSQSFEITPTSSYVVNGRAVTFEQLRKTLAADRSSPVVVAYFSASRKLSRIIVGEIRQ